MLAAAQNWCDWPGHRGNAHGCFIGRRANQAGNRRTSASVGSAEKLPDLGMEGGRHQLWNIPDSRGRARTRWHCQRSGRGRSVARHPRLLGIAGRGHGAGLRADGQKRTGARLRSVILLAGCSRVGASAQTSTKYSSDRHRIDAGTFHTRDAYSRPLREAWPHRWP